MANKQPLEFLVWDVTEPDDSIEFIKLIQQKFGWKNLLDSVPSARKDALYIQQPNKYSIFMPCGKEGVISKPQLFKESLTFQQQVFSPDHGTGRDPAILYLSGHGIPGFLFSNNTEPIPIVSSNIIGALGNPGVISPRAYQWNSQELKYVIFSSCRQLAGKPQQALWTRAMRGKQPLHGILGYRDTSPAAKQTKPVNKEFLKALKRGETILNAWRLAHRKLRKNWAALIHKDALKDTMTQWTRNGFLMSKPPSDGDILYFDSETPRGRIVQEPKRDINIELLRPLEKTYLPGKELPPWAPVSVGNAAWIRIEFTKISGEIFESGDRIWISAVQVRPNYERPFDIRQLFSIVLPQGNTLAQNGIRVSAKIHDRKKFSARDLDTYEISLPTNKLQAKRMEKWARLDSSQTKFYLPIKIGKAQFLLTQNNRLRRMGEHIPLPIFYLMGRIEKKSGKSYGIPVLPRSKKVSQKALQDDFQFAQFVLQSVLPKGEVHN